MKKINTIIKKEWAEVFKNRMVIFTVAFLPLLMTAIPLGIIFATRDVSGTGEALDSELPSEMTQGMCPQGLSSGECFQVFMVSEFMMMFSLEPLLATPITTGELLVGKALAAVIPAVLATYLAFGVFAVGSWLIVANK